VCVHDELGTQAMVTSSGRSDGAGDSHAGAPRSDMLARLSTHHLTITIVGIFVALLGIGMLIAVS
jgi:hypothetical protein